MASTIKVTNIDTPDSTGNITVDRPLAGSGASLTSLPAANLTGTISAISGVNLTALNATNLGSGTVPDARFPATLPAASGVNLTALNGSNIASGTVADARLPATITATTFKGEGAINGWIVMNGVGTVSIFDSHNVSSLTDSGVGLYGINWDTNFNSNYYANTALVKAYSGGTEYMVIANINSGTTNIKAYAGSSLSDKSEIYVLAIGDSA